MTVVAFSLARFTPADLAEFAAIAKPRIERGLWAGFVRQTDRDCDHLLVTYPFTSPRQAGSGMEIWGRLLRALASRLVMYCHGSMPRRRQVSNTLRVAA
jgi:hypothetical protein